MRSAHHDKMASQSDTAHNQYSTMPTHKFHIGQTVFLIPALSVPGGAYVVTRRMPERDGEFQYRVKSVNEPHERVVRESEMSDVP